jgi:hypothetical protein
MEIACIGPVSPAKSTSSSASTQHSESRSVTIKRLTALSAVPSASNPTIPLALAHRKSNTRMLRVTNATNSDTCALPAPTLRSRALCAGAFTLLAFVADFAHKAKRLLLPARLLLQLQLRYSILPSPRPPPHPPPLLPHAHQLPLLAIRMLPLHCVLQISEWQQKLEWEQNARFMKLAMLMVHNNQQRSMHCMHNTNRTPPHNNMRLNLHLPCLILLFPNS